MEGMNQEELKKNLPKYDYSNYEKHDDKRAFHGEILPVFGCCHQSMA